MNTENVDMHPNVMEAFQQIDAAMFSGDSFHYSGNRKYLQSFIERWQRGLNEHEVFDDQEE